MTQTPGDDQGTPQPGQWGQPAGGQPPGWPAPYGQGGQGGQGGPGGAGRPPYPVYGGYGYPPPQKHPEADAAMIWGLVAMIGGMACYLPFVVAPVAWVKGRRVVREIDASPTPQLGRSEATTGMVLGIIGTVLLVIGVLALVGLIALGLAGAFEESGTSNV